MTARRKPTAAEVARARQLRDAAATRRLTSPERAELNELTARAEPPATAAKPRRSKRTRKGAA